MNAARPRGFLRFNRGLLYVYLSSLFFAVMGIAVKGLGESYSGAVAAFWRSFIGLLFLLVIAWKKKIPACELLGSNRKLLFLRGICGTVALIFFFSAIKIVSVSVATMLCYTYPLFATVIAFAIGQESLRFRTAGAMALAFCGVFVVLSPSFGGEFGFGEIVGLASGFFAGAAIVAVRLLRKSDSPVVVVTWFSLCGTLAGLPFLVLEGHLPTLSDFGIILLIGATATTAQLLLTKGYHYCTTNEGSTMALMTVVNTAVLAYLFYGESLPPQKIVGGLLVLSGAALVTQKSGNRAYLD